MLKSAIIPLFVALATFTSAHPGESEEHHLAEARALKESHHYIKRSGLAYSGCSNSARKRSLNNAVAERRAAEIAELRAGVKARKLALAKRQAPSGVSGSAAMPSGTMGAGGPDGNSTGATGGGGGGGSATFDSYGETLLNTSHASTRTDLTSNSTSSELFDSSSGNDTTCLLQPEVTIGPYWVAGEYVREDMSEDQDGLPLYMSTQVIDVATCEPVVGLYWEMWHANASGVYSGVVASGNGDSSDASNINATFCRGIQPTDDQGVARILSVAPGHYTGRTTHAHVIGHTNVTVYENGTIGTGSSGDGDSVALHIGQLFFDQALLDDIATVSPYSENTQTVTSNSEDSILAQSAVEGASDPFFEYVYLGDSVADGIYAWVTVGITTNETKTTQAASYLDADGGHAGTNSMTEGGSMGGDMTSNTTDADSNSSGTGVSSTATDTTNALDAAASASASSSSSAVAASSNACKRRVSGLGARGVGKALKGLGRAVAGAAP